jgi:hypothetical protein
MAIFIGMSRHLKNTFPHFNDLPFGAIIGRATISNVAPVKILQVTDELINRLTMEDKRL